MVLDEIEKKITDAAEGIKERYIKAKNVTKIIVDSTKKVKDTIVGDNKNGEDEKSPDIPNNEPPTEMTTIEKHNVQQHTTTSQPEIEKKNDYNLVSKTGTTVQPEIENKSGSGLGLKIGIGVGAGVVGLIIIVLVIIIIIKKRKTSQNSVKLSTKPLTKSPSAKRKTTKS